jgi:TPR repeat protein
MRHSRALVLICLIAASATLTALAQKSTHTEPSIAAIEKQADALRQEKRYQEAAALYREAAERGSISSELALGNLYLSGYNLTTNDNAEAMEWFGKAAHQGNALAQTQMGNMYLWGRGTSADPRQACYWFLQAAIQGNVFSQNSVGMCYVRGRGVAKDLNQARAWFQKAADQGFQNAALNIAMYVTPEQGQPASAAEQPGPASQQSYGQQGTCSGFEMAEYDPTKDGTYLYYGAAWGRATLEEAKAAAHDALFKDGLHNPTDFTEYGREFDRVGQCEHPHGAVAGILKYCNNSQPCGNNSYLTFGIGYGETTDEAISNAMADCGRYSGLQFDVTVPCRLLSQW